MTPIRSCNRAAQSALRQSRGRWAHALLLACAVSFILPAPARAQSYDRLQIDEGLSLMREPVISETGMVAWYGYESDLGQVTSHVWIWKDGEKVRITDGHDDPQAENLRPQVWSNSVTWSSSFIAPRGQNTSWILVDVPNQHEPYEELDAQYSTTANADGAGGSRDIQSQRFFRGTDELDQQILADSVDVTATNRPAKPTARVHRHPSGKAEICLWNGSGPFDRITFDERNDIAPTIGDGIVAWQKAKGFPFGWEIMLWENGERWQITTNFYYDMAPQAFGKLVVWYGWDGEDYEIYLYDHTDRSITQVTNNRFDDESPRIWGDSITWEGFSAVEPDIYYWSRKERKVRVISNNIEDDVNPRIWKNYVVWQSFDGDDYEIVLYDANEDTSVKVTQNAYDDMAPSIADNTICWQGYVDNYDAEIFATTLDKLNNNEPAEQITDNTHEDQEPQTAAGYVVWQAREDERFPIYLAKPR